MLITLLLRVTTVSLCTGINKSETFAFNNHNPNHFVVAQTESVAEEVTVPIEHAVDEALKCGTLLKYYCCFSFVARTS